MRWIPSWRLIVGTFMSFVAFGVIVFLALYILIPVPEAPSVMQQNSQILDSQGEVIGQLSVENRIVVELADIPDHVQKAVLAAEDRSFGKNGGVSPTGTIRAALNNLRGQDMQGGSTITQQYVKNFYLSSERSISRKAKEFIIAIKIAQRVEPEEILKDYLNKIYFGRGSYGIQAASHAYFRKDVKRLTVSEGAFLAGIISGPELADPLDGASQKERATDRWKFVLNGMVTEGWLDAAQEKKIHTAGLPKVQPDKSSASKNPDIQQWGYIAEMLRSEMKTYGLDENSLATGGYKITTTLNKKMLKDASQSVEAQMGPRSSWPVGTQIGMASVDPQTGALRSFYAGNFEARKYNSATMDRPQGGSTYKVFGLVAALQGVGKTESTPNEPAHEEIKPISLDSRYNGDSPYVMGQQQQSNTKKSNTAVTVSNFGGKAFGCINLVDATADSVNTVFAKLNERVGSRATMQVAFNMGLPEDKTSATLRSIDASGLNVLGAGNSSPLVMANAYGHVANQGKRIAPYLIQTISTDNGVIFDRDQWAPANWKKKTGSAKDLGEQVFNPGVMADTTFALRSVVEKGTARYATRLGRPAAGKTGTAGMGTAANGNPKDNASAWFVGFTPQLSTAVALHRIDPKTNKQLPLKPWSWNGRSAGSQVTGATFPLWVWTDYMQSAHKDKNGQPLEVKNFPDPVRQGEVVDGSGCNQPPPAPEPQQTQTQSVAPNPGQQPAPQPTQAPTTTDPQQPTATSNPPTTTEPATTEPSVPGLPIDPNQPRRPAEFPSFPSLPPNTDQTIPRGQVP